MVRAKRSSKPIVVCWVTVSSCSRSGGKAGRQRGTAQGKESRRCIERFLVGTQCREIHPFNAMTHAGYAANQLFATLDTTSRKLWLEGAGNIVISDTVGFIRNLPHELVAAFHATLEATAEADLLLHIVDGANPARDDQMAEVDKVLAEIGAQDVPQIVVLNKQDLTGLPAAAERDEYGRIRRVRVSAVTGEGLPLLRQALAEHAVEKVQRLGRERNRTVVDAVDEPSSTLESLIDSPITQ